MTVGAEPIVSPTMAGGLFAIERKWFFEAGWYDEGMKVICPLLLLHPAIRTTLIIQYCQYTDTDV